MAIQKFPEIHGMYNLYEINKFKVYTITTIWTLKKQIDPATNCQFTFCQPYLFSLNRPIQSISPNVRDMSVCYLSTPRNSLTERDGDF